VALWATIVRFYAAGFSKVIICLTPLPRRPPHRLSSVSETMLFTSLKSSSHPLGTFFLSGRSVPDVRIFIFLALEKHVFFSFNFASFGESPPESVFIRTRLQFLPSPLSISDVVERLFLPPPRLIRPPQAQSVPIPFLSSLNFPGTSSPPSSWAFPSFGDFHSVWGQRIRVFFLTLRPSTL